MTTLVGLTFYCVFSLSSNGPTLEKEEIIRNHWPECSGAILITSRQFTNFSNDANRVGETVQAFNGDQSWTYLSALLSSDDGNSDRLVTSKEIEAAEQVLSKLSGLPLAIKQMASTILYQNRFKDTETFCVEFNKALKELPPKQVGERSEAVQALDTRKEY